MELYWWDKGHGKLRPNRYLLEYPSTLGVFFAADIDAIDGGNVVANTNIWIFGNSGIFPDLLDKNSPVSIVTQCNPESRNVLLDLDEARKRIFYMLLRNVAAINGIDFFLQNNLAVPL